MVTEVAVSPGQEVRAGDKLIVLEAMKMLTTVSASADGTIAEVLVKRRRAGDKPRPSGNGPWRIVTCSKGWRALASYGQIGGKSASEFTIRNIET